jgi:hypothetical protein
VFSLLSVVQEVALCGRSDYGLRGRRDYGEVDAFRNCASASLMCA